MSEIPKEYFVEEIPVIAPIDNSRFVPVLDPRFVVLGMLDEYFGRRIVEGGSTVEHFFVDESPLANVFASYLTLHGASLGVDAAGISVVLEQTGHARVDSSTMNAHVNALYRYEFDADRLITGLDGLTRRCTNATLSIDDFPRKSSRLYTPSEMNPRFSYLYGLFLRFGQDGLTVEMANASEKVELIKRLLEELDVEWIEHRYSVQGAPTCHRIAFGADERLAAFLQQALVERAEALATSASHG